MTVAATDNQRSPARAKGTAASASTPRRLRNILNLDDFEVAAKKVLPRPIFAYVSSATEQGVTFRANRASFAQYAFKPRFMTDVSKRSQETTLLGRTYAHPFGIAPMGALALSAYRGDLTLAKAAGARGIPMAMSSASLIRMEEVAKVGPHVWFQAYLPGVPERIEALVRRAAAAGFGTLVVTIDSPIISNREQTRRAGFTSPLRPSLSLAWQGVTHPRWLFGNALKTIWNHGIPHFENSSDKRGAPVISRHVNRDFKFRDHLSWAHLEQVRAQWKGSLVIKGILDPDDARIAREAGADAVILSNHGGRQLDSCVAPLQVLEATIDAAKGVPVMIDGGIRRGGDVLKALALGAAFVFLGRPFIFAAAVAGEAGVRHAISLLELEIQRDMGSLGIVRPSEMNKDRLVPTIPGIAQR